MPTDLGQPDLLYSHFIQSLKTLRFEQCVPKRSVNPYFTVLAILLSVDVVIVVWS